jgi:hypothetical protein
LLDDYRKPYLRSASGLTAGEFEAAEEKSHAAKQVFETSFGSMKTLSQSNSTTQYPCLDLETMKDESEGTYDNVLRQLRQWGRELQWPEDMESGYWVAKADTAEEVSELVKPFTDSGLWVFVSITR